LFHAARVEGYLFRLLSNEDFVSALFPVSSTSLFVALDLIPRLKTLLCVPLLFSFLLLSLVFSLVAWMVLVLIRFHHCGISTHVRSVGHGILLLVLRLALTNGSFGVSRDLGFRISAHSASCVQQFSCRGNNRASVSHD